MSENINELKSLITNRPKAYQILSKILSGTSKQI